MIRRSRLDGELQREMNTHLALLEDDAQAHGLSAHEARRRARRAFGNPLVYVRMAMLVLFGVVGLVLCVACANVANLLLLRSEARRAEFALRAALGASRSQLSRSVVAESVLLSLAAGTAGLALTWLTLQGVVAVIPNGLPRVESIHLDARVILFAIATAFLVAAFASIAPEVLAARTDPAGRLRSGAQGRAEVVGRGSRRTLVVLQVALAATVVIIAGLLTRSLWRLQTVDMGLAADRLVFVDLDLPQAKYADRERHLKFLTEMVGQLEAAPEIAGATPVNLKPFAGSGGWELPTFTAETQSGDGAVAIAVLTLLAASALATYIPIRRAVRVDPNVLLKTV